MSEQIDVVINKCMTALDSARLFYRAKWSQVREGDVILVQGDGEPITEVTVKEIHTITKDDGSKVITVYYRLGYATYGVPCNPLDTAYVQSRF